MGLATNAAQMIEARGQTMTLRRIGSTDIPLKGVRQAGQLIEAGGSSTQQEFKIRIAPTEIAVSSWSPKAPSARGDVMVVGGVPRTILDVEPIYAGTELAMWELLVAG